MHSEIHILFQRTAQKSVMPMLIVLKRRMVTGVSVELDMLEMDIPA